MKPIKFFFMRNCGFCTKASNILDKDIKSGVIIEYDSTEAPDNVTGFPYFEYNGNTFKGCPLSREHLLKELKYSDGSLSTTEEDYKENYTYDFKSEVKNKYILIVSSLMSVIMFLFIILLFINIFFHNVKIEKGIKLLLLFLFIVTISIILYYIFNKKID